MTKSIIQDEKVCYRCGTPFGLHKHHCIEGTGRRKHSEEDGLWVWLCGRHHNLSNEGVHFNKAFDMALKKTAEARWLYVYGKTIEDWIKRYDRNYL